MSLVNRVYIGKSQMCTVSVPYSTMPKYCIGALNIGHRTLTQSCTTGNTNGKEKVLCQERLSHVPANDVMYCEMLEESVIEGVQLEKGSKIPSAVGPVSHSET